MEDQSALDCHEILVTCLYVGLMSVEVSVQEDERAVVEFDSDSYTSFIGLKITSGVITKRVTYHHTQDTSDSHTNLNFFDDRGIFLVYIDYQEYTTELFRSKLG